MEDNFLKIAKQAALKAGKVIKKYAGESHQKGIKHGDVSDFVTEADLEAEEEIVEILTKNFPGHNIIAEENAKINKGSEYTWIIDPLDGSITYAHSIPYFSVSIGLLEKNKPVLGVIYNISFEHMFWAQKDRGAYMNNEKIHVSSVRILEEAVGTLDFGHRGKRPEKIEKYVKPLINKIGYPYSFGSGVATLASVAKGMLDMYVSQAWIWDFAAGAVIIQEAGGVVTDFEGKEPDWTKERLDIIASNGLIHEQILEVLSSSLRGSGEAGDEAIRVGNESLPRLPR